jgi:inorganic pyrophosphatase
VTTVSFKAHPWHGVALGPSPPELINVYVEIVPADTVKYEIDKATGHLRVDRPQKYSSHCPALYGFVPQTFCGRTAAACAERRTTRTNLRGDGDPLDILVLTEKQINHGDILIRAIPVGGLTMLDGGEADDKIIAVLEGDVVYGSCKDITELPDGIIKRIEHYFLTYKEMPGTMPRTVELASRYGKKDALELIAAAANDYRLEIRPA